MSQDRAWLLLEKHHGKETVAFAEDVQRLAGGEPVAYLIGWQPFLGLTIFLDSRPLIPRPETEWWTERLLSSLQEAAKAESGVGLGQAARSAPDAAFADDYSFLDLCAGSGAIGCAALAQLPNAHVYFGELDSAHRPTIEKNIRENHLDASRATVRIGDLFAPYADMRFDVIAANPPYVPRVRELPKSVAHYEPPLALYAGDDGLAIMRRLATELPSHLTKNGMAWIECDRGNAQATQALFEEAGLAACVINDQYGKPRVVVVSSS